MSMLRIWSPLRTWNTHSLRLMPRSRGCKVVALASRRHFANTCPTRRNSQLAPLYTPSLRASVPYKCSATLSTRTTTTAAGDREGLASREDAPTPRNVDQPFAHLPAYQLPTRGILSVFPSSWVPYLELSRIDRTNGFYGFYVSYLIGMGWAASISPVALSLSEVGSVAAIFVVWTVWHRGAVCTVNDILDRDYDRQVERTRLRPLARRAIPVRNAWQWYWTQVATSAGIVSLMPHAAECFYHAVPIVFLLSVYPLFKRWTNYPQVVLAVPLSWAILLSCSALGVDPWTVQNTAVTAASMCLFGSEMARLVVLDYVNACQDTRDDVKAGVKSMAVKYWNTEKFIATMGGIQVSLLMAAGVLAELSPIYFAIGVGGNIAMISWMARTVDRKSPKTCAWWFQRGSWLVGGMTALALYLEYFSQAFTANEEKNKGTAVHNETVRL